MKPTPSTPTLTLSLSLQFADSSDRALLARHQVARWIRAALDKPARITVRIVGHEEGLALNHDYRGKDHATNVLTFDYSHAPVTVADIVLCAPVIEAEAIALNKPLQEHYAHLVLHGCLHAQGYEHETTAKDAFEMEALEAWLMMGCLGFENPYG